MPSVDVINQCWQQYILNEQWMADDFSKLTANQKSVMKALAKNPVSALYGEYMRKTTNLSPSSIKKTIQSLIKTDMLHRDESGLYCILDPAMRYFLLIKNSLMHLTGLIVSVLIVK